MGLLLWVARCVAVAPKHAHWWLDLPNVTVAESAPTKHLPVEVVLREGEYPGIEE